MLAAHLELCMDRTFAELDVISGVHTKRDVRTSLSLKQTGFNGFNSQVNFIWKVLILFKNCSIFRLEEKILVFFRNKGTQLMQSF